MNIYFSAWLHCAYFKALSIIKTEQPKLWEDFIKEISTFSVVPNYYIAAVLTHIAFTKEIIKSKKMYSEYWKEYATTIQTRLSNLFGVELKRTKITAYVCVTPLYIRNIEKGLFLLPICANKQRVMNIIVHELSHFYCYQSYQVYKYEEDDAWEISEYLVPYLIRLYFKDMCQTKTNFYFGQVPEKYKKHIKYWLGRKISFEEMLNNIKYESN